MAIHKTIRRLLIRGRILQSKIEHFVIWRGKADVGWGMQFLQVDLSWAPKGMVAMLWVCRHDALWKNCSWRDLEQDHLSNSKRKEGHSRELVALGTLLKDSTIIVEGLAADILFMPPVHASV